MTAKDFVKLAQECYGFYPAAYLPFLVAFLSDHSEARLDSLWKVVLAIHELRWRTPPDIAVLRKAIAHTTDTASTKALLDERTGWETEAGKLPDLVKKLADGSKP